MIAEKTDDLRFDGLGKAEEKGADHIIVLSSDISDGRLYQRIDALKDAIQEKGLSASIVMGSGFQDGLYLHGKSGPVETLATQDALGGDNVSEAQRQSQEQLAILRGYFKDIVQKYGIIDESPFSIPEENRKHGFVFEITYPGLPDHIETKQAALLFDCIVKAGVPKNKIQVLYKGRGVHSSIVATFEGAHFIKKEPRALHHYAMDNEAGGLFSVDLISLTRQIESRNNLHHVAGASEMGRDQRTTVRAHLYPFAALTETEIVGMLMEAKIPHKITLSPSKELDDAIDCALMAYGRNYRQVKTECRGAFDKYIDKKKARPSLRRRIIELFVNESTEKKEKQFYRRLCQRALMVQQTIGPLGRVHHHSIISASPAGPQQHRLMAVDQRTDTRKHILSVLRKKEERRDVLIRSITEERDVLVAALPEIVPVRVDAIQEQPTHPEQLRPVVVAGVLTPIDSASDVRTNPLFERTPKLARELFVADGTKAKRVTFNLVEELINGLEQEYCVLSVPLTQLSGGVQYFLETKIPAWRTQIRPFRGRAKLAEQEYKALQAIHIEIKNYDLFKTNVWHPSKPGKSARQGGGWA